MKKPIRVEDKVFLVDADSELICKTESATPEELHALVTAFNNQPEPGKLWYTVVGGMTGDDMDCSACYQCATAQEAREAFGDEMWAWEAIRGEFRMTDAELEAAQTAANEAGKGVYINFVLVSETPTHML